VTGSDLPAPWHVREDETGARPDRSLRVGKDERAGAGPDEETS
jgi:hypothetical protein